MKGIVKVLNMWYVRDLSTLCQKTQALKIYTLYKAWYLAEILPFPDCWWSAFRRRPVILVEGPPRETGLG
jgi:hypothetical protein